MPNMRETYHFGNLNLIFSKKEVLNPSILLKIPKNVFGCYKVVAEAQCQNKETCD
jgi:hypothetical protein